jgi:hypothetical protein
MYEERIFREIFDSVLVANKTTPYGLSSRIAAGVTFISSRSNWELKPMMEGSNIVYLCHSGTVQQFESMTKIITLPYQNLEKELVPVDDASFLA